MPDLLPPQRPTDIDLSAITEAFRRWSSLTWLHRATALRLLFVGGLLGALASFLRLPEYSSYATILPYRDAGPRNSIAGLAGLAGIRLPGTGADATISADLYPEVAGTVDFYSHVGQAPLPFSTLSKSISSYEYYRYHYETDWRRKMARYTIGLPRALLSTLSADRRAASMSPAPSSDATFLVLSRQELDALGFLRDRLQVKIDRRTGIVTVSARMPDPAAAAALASLATQELTKSVIHFEVRRATEMLAFVEAQQRSAGQRYDRALQALARFEDRNRNLVSAVALVERTRLQDERNLAFELLQQLTTELEQARLKVSQETPAMTVLERPVLPIEKASPRRSLFVGTGIVLGMLCALYRISAIDRRARHSATSA